MAFQKSKGVVCQDCFELVEPTKIYLIFKTDHYYFLCEQCMKERGVTGEVWRKPRTRKSKS